jgi:Protein of unknown function (DUF3892)
MPFNASEVFYGCSRCAPCHLDLDSESDASTEPVTAPQKIRFIGGLNSDGSAWKLSQEMAVDSIENGKCQLYLVVGRQPVSVIVAASHHGHKYLKAETDPEEPTSLLNLPECPFLTR